jgi:hypothetical protein
MGGDDVTEGGTAAAAAVLEEAACAWGSIKYAACCCCAWSCIRNCCWLWCCMTGSLHMLPMIAWLKVTVPVCAESVASLGGKGTGMGESVAASCGASLRCLSSLSSFTSCSDTSRSNGKFSIFSGMIAKEALKPPSPRRIEAKLGAASRSTAPAPLKNGWRDGLCAQLLCMGKSGKSSKLPLIISISVLRDKKYLLITDLQVRNFTQIRANLSLLRSSGTVSQRRQQDGCLWSCALFTTKMNRSC